MISTWTGHLLSGAAYIAALIFSEPANSQYTPLITEEL